MFFSHPSFHPSFLPSFLPQDEVLTVFSMVALSANEICGSFLEDCGSTYNPFNQQWNISIPGNKPSVEPVMAPKVRGSRVEGGG